MRHACLLVSLLCVVGCPDFGLEGREFLCSTEVNCASGESCIDQLCTVPADASPDASVLDSSATDATTDAAVDAAPEPDANLLDAPSGPEICGNGLDDDGDTLVDCQDPECGLASCDDQNVCTDDICESSGSCRNDSLTGFSCGIGCLCASGTPSETACEDMSDNDVDGDVDCIDSDCSCPGTLLCCPDGSCQLGC